MPRQSRRLIPGLTIAVAAAVAWALPAGARAVPQGASGPADPALLASFEWRSIGPDRGGRSIGVSGVKGRPDEAYFGAVGGGLWKTTDGGQEWTPVTDGQITSSSVGAVAVSDTNPDVVFIGTGESCIRGNIQPGDGVYKSTDAGKTWRHVGFRDAQNISKIRIHPANPDVVFVAAFGQHGVPNEERGVFKSTDGGATWRKVLYRDERTGGVDLWIDMRNPDVVFAALWQAYRVEYQMSSGGPGSGLFKSTDGGETWTEITRNTGLPAEGAIGRIGVSVSGADSNRVYALVEHDNGGLFASDDAGATWRRVNEERRIRQRAFYYTHVTADPVARDTVYVLNTSAFKSTDGGRTLQNVGNGTHVDHHDLWIDPDDPQHLVIGNDGGGAVSTQGGSGTWSAEDYPTAQYYHAVTTAHVPYHVCGAQQDGPTVCLPNEAGGGGRGGRGGGRGGGGAVQTYSPGGAEPAYIAPDPEDTDVFFSGGNNGTFLIYTNRKTGQQREIHPYPRMFSGEPSSALVERVQWTFPIVYSPLDPNVLYTATQHVWRTTTNGQTWDRISPDLTKHDPETMGHSGGPITGDMNGPEVYATVFALAPSKVDINVLWAGSDDGLIHLTRDAGKTWANVTPTDMPQYGRVSIIDASAFDAGTAYAAVKRPLMGDQSPYLYRTQDFGKTWQKVVSGLRADDYVHVVREDPTRRGLLYAGTQHGVYYSYDDGGAWHPLSLNLPDVQISDLIVEKTDLVIATHGRSFYVLDDINPIRQYGQGAAATDVVLFAPSPAYRSTQGATIQYWVRQAAPDLKIEIVDPAGTVVQTFEPSAGGRGGAGRAGGGRGGGGGGGGRGGGRGGGGASTTPGVNSVTWNLRYPSATGFPGMILWGGNLTGPAAAPGTYQVRLTASGRTQTKSFEVRRHPLHRDVTDAGLEAQFGLGIRIRDKVTEAVIRIRNVKSQVAERLGTSSDARLATAAERLIANLSAVEQEIYQVRNESGQDPLNFPIKINNRLASLLSSLNRGDGAPIGNAEPIFNDLVVELKVQTDRLAQVLAADLAAVNTELRRLGLEPISPG
jgi:photosystem II stability/assembly factor-like uncharacterized protein